MNASCDNLYQRDQAPSINKGMFLSHLYETEQSDKSSRLEAVMAFTQIKYWLAMNEDNNYQRLIAMDTPVEGSFLMPLHLCDLDHDYPDLSVAFTPKYSQGGAAMLGSLGTYANRTKKVIFVGCLLAAGDKTHLATRWGGTSKIFVHEFQHYLLSNKSPAKGSAGHVTGGGMDDYFNDAGETNSYYQEAAHEAVGYFKTVKDHAPTKTGQFTSMTTQELVAFIIEKFTDSDFMGALTDGNRRAFHKRMARCVVETIRPMLEK